MIGIQYEPQRLTEAYEEVDETTVFCPNGHNPRRIAVEMVHGRWEPCDKKDLLCPVCGEEGEF